jgi:hypothetical protein
MNSKKDIDDLINDYLPNAMFNKENLTFTKKNKKPIKIIKKNIDIDF